MAESRDGDEGRSSAGRRRGRTTALNQGRDALVEAAIRDPAVALYADRILRFMREFAHDEKPVRPWGGGLNARSASAPW